MVDRYSTLPLIHVRLVTYLTFSEQYTCVVSVLPNLTCLWPTELLVAEYILALSSGVYSSSSINQVQVKGMCY